MLTGDTGVIASGISGLYAEEAIGQLESDVSILRIGTFPPPDDLCAEFIKHVSKVLIIEELEPVLEEYVERAARVHNPELEILGKKTGISRGMANWIPLSPEMPLLICSDSHSHDGRTAIIGRS